MITRERLNRRAVLVLLVLAGVLAYTTFQWGGVVRTGRYQYLLVLGLLAILLSLGRSRDEWSPLPNRVLRWTVVLLPAYVLLQVVPLPVAVLRVLSPARAEALDALGPVGAKVSFASLSVFPAGTFQYFLLVCGYLVNSPSGIRELTWRLRDSRWLVIWPILGIAALEAGLGLWQYFGGTGEQLRWGTYANHNHYAGFLEMALPFAVMYPVASVAPRTLQVAFVGCPRACGFGCVGSGGVDIRRDYSFLLTDGIHRNTFFPVRDGRIGARDQATELGDRVPKAPMGRGWDGRCAGAGRFCIPAA